MRKYLILALLSVCVYFVYSFFQFNGGIGADSLSYFGIAADLPKPETALFPLGYPIFLRIFYEVFGDWFWASKFLNVFLLIFIFGFSYWKMFYFRETVILLVGKTVFYVFTSVMSESLFLFFCYFLVYLIHERFYERLRSTPFVVWTSLLLILLFAVRYSGIYIYLSVGIFWLYMFLKVKGCRYQKDFFIVLVFAGAGILTYLIFNQLQFGSLTGENLRGKPAEFHLLYILRDLLGMINVANPFIGIKPASHSFFSIAFQIGLAVVDVFIALQLFKMFKRKKNLLRLDFHYLLWLIAAVYTVALFLSGLFQQIEEMNMRMLAAANFLLFFSFLIIYFTDLKNDKVIFRIACFFLVFLIAYSLKSPGNYLEVRRQLEPQMSKFSSKKFLYNNEKDQVMISTYKIPFTKKEVKYPHTNNQVGSIKQSAAGTFNPKIKWLKYDTVADKSQVLYTSELSLK